MPRGQELHEPKVAPFVGTGRQVEKPVRRRGRSRRWFVSRFKGDWGRALSKQADFSVIQNIAANMLSRRICKAEADSVSLIVGE